MRSYNTRRLYDLLIGCIQTSVTNIVTNCACEQERFLWNDSYLATQRTLCDTAYVVTINQYGTILYIIKPCEQSRNRTFTRSSWPYNSDCLARRNLQVQAMQDWRILMVAQGH